MIEDFKKYKFFYVNGSSFSEGGGLEEPEIRNESFRHVYEKEYGVSWKNRKEINWGHRLSELIGIPCINEAQSGGGPMRSIRMAYDFIYKNWNKRNEFFIILENPDASRCDVYHKKTNSYFIVNTDMKTNKMLSASRDYWNKKYSNEDNNLQYVFNNWVDNHFDLKNQIIENEKALIGLYSFCKSNGIKIFMMHNTFFIFTNIISNDDILKDDIYDFSLKNKLTISDEINKFGIKTEDTHPGYFGHIEYAKQIYKFLKNE